MPRMKAVLGEDITQPNPFTRFVRAVWEMTAEGAVVFLQDLINQALYRQSHEAIVSLFFQVEHEVIQPERSRHFTTWGRRRCRDWVL